jgi:hypothetical protein
VILILILFELVKWPKEKKIHTSKWFIATKEEREKNLENPHLKFIQNYSSIIHPLSIFF